MKTALILAIILFSGALYAENLLPNGNFEEADPANPQKPLRWELMDGLGVQWATVPESVGASPHGKAIRMDTSITEEKMVESYTKAGLSQWVFPHPQKNPIAATYGLSFYSEAVPVKPGKAYRISFDFMSEKGTKGKVWFRGYGDLAGKQKRLYEGVINCESKGKWSHFSEIKHPTKNTPNVTQFKVMLFVYFPPGISWFDNISIEEIDEPTTPTSP